MFEYVIKPKSKVTTRKQIPFVKNQNFIKQNNCNTKYDSEFYGCMRNVMRLCRWLGLFPVEGLERTSWDKLKFNVKSFYGIYYFLTIFGQIINVIISLIHLFQSGATLSLLTGTMFYFNGFVSTMLLLITAQKWSSLVKKVAALEKASGIRINRYTSKKIVILAYTINAFGLVEHCFSLNYNLKYIKGCYPKYSLCEVVTTFLFPKMPYNIAHSNIVQLISQIYLEVTGSQGTFLWSFTDVVNISISIYLIAYFEKLNKHIFAAKDNKSTNWRKLRDQQGNLVQLVDLMNHRFDCFVLLSYTCNLYFMCVQLYNTLGEVPLNADHCDQKGFTDFQHSFDHHAYFFFSFAYLMFKTLTLSHLAANVYAVARKPLNALGDVHPSVYSIEIQRFYRQINYTTIGVSGVFFYITRGMILKVISSLVTYELMLIQIYNRRHLSTCHTPSTITNNNTVLSPNTKGNVSIW